MGRHFFTISVFNLFFFFFILPVPFPLSLLSPLPFLHPLLAAPAILKALAEAMVDEGSSQVVLSSIADLLHTIFLRFASAGASELFLNAILAIWSGKVGHAGSAEREKALAAAAGEAVADESTGLACLTVQDMQNVVLQLAAAAPSSYHSFKSLFNAVSKVCKGQQTKDFLQDYLTK